ncbi:hypothetical protein [Candidatus Poriferisodalis sp.]|uniref:hypothetical protein n=1 Tax=Candidatus Poriferisodalis sp. TaxID=3101277 RepID=UPI003B014DA6
MAMILTVTFYGCLLGGVLAIAAAIVFAEQRVSALWLSTMLLLVASVLAIGSIGIFLLVVPIFTGLAAVTQSRQRDRTS